MASLGEISHAIALSGTVGINQEAWDPGEIFSQTAGWCRRRRGRIERSRESTLMAEV